MKAMKNPFHKKSKKEKELEEQERAAENDESAAEQIVKTTEEIEAEKERKRFLREERKFLKQHAEKRKKMERFVAPVLLILTILLSYVIYLMHQ